MSGTPLDRRSSRPIVVAIGGNSITRADQVGTLDEQRVNTAATCDVLADAIAAGHRLVLTHGNGPQVGSVLLRVELASDRVYRLPLDICDADTQGGIGYMLQQILGDKLAARGMARRVATIVTQVRVDRDDPAFLKPTKPIGPFMNREEAERRQREKGWQVVEDKRGFRRVVPSPDPIEILELEAIRAVFDAGITPICVGGGGVPVVQATSGELEGREAVIDKDLASSLLARQLGAEYLVITTGVPKVMLDWQKPTQRVLDRLSVAEARQYQNEGQFPPGSMGPKITAAIRFVEAGGTAAVICDPESLRAALLGTAGTWIAAG